MLPTAAMITAAKLEAGQAILTQLLIYWFQAFSQLQQMLREITRRLHQTRPLK